MGSKAQMEGLLSTAGKTTICNRMEGEEAATDANRSLATGSL